MAKARPTHLGRRLRVAREDRGLSQAELARRAGVDPSSVSKVESGQTLAPSGDYLSQLATVLGVPVDALLYGETQAEPDLSDLRQAAADRLGAAHAEKLETVVALLQGKPARDRDFLLTMIIDMVKALPSLDAERRG